MSHSETREAKRFASIAEVASAQCKMYTEEARKAPEYTDLAKEYAEVAKSSAQAAAESALSASNSESASSVNASNAQSSADSASQSEQSASDSASSAASDASSAEQNAQIAASAVSKTVRVTDIDIDALPNAAARANKVLTFDANGKPIVSTPSSGSAQDVLNQLASPTGASLVGYGDKTMADVAKEIISQVQQLSTFESGGEVNTQRDLIYSDNTKYLYYWSGEFPKTIPALSSPESTGGIGEGGWVPITDAYTKKWTGDNFRLTGYSKLQNQTFQSGSAFSSSKQVLFDEASGLYWMWTGALPKTVNAGDDPKSDPSYYAVGLLNGKGISDLSGWCDTVSNVDVTSQMQQYFRTLAYLKMPAICYGSVKVSSQIICFDVPYDMSKLVVTLDLAAVDSTITNNGSVFKTTEPDEQVITGFTTDLTAINQDTSSVLLQFGQCTFSYVADDVSIDKAYIRSSGQVIRKTDTLVCTATDRSIFRSTPSIYALNGTVTAYIKPIKNKIEIKLPSIILVGAYPDSSKIENIIECRRNNVRIIGGHYDERSINMVAHTFVSIQQCAFIEIDGLLASNNFGDSEYAIGMFSTAFVNISNCVFPYGWAFIDGNFMRNTIIDKCVIGNAFGAHAMQWNLTVRNCTMYGVTSNKDGATIAGGIHVTGGGQLLVQDIEYWFSGGAPSAEYLVGCRQDYGQGWEGDVTVQRVKVYANGIANPFIIVYMAGGYPNTMDYTRPYVYMGKKIIVQDVTVYKALIDRSPANVVIAPVWFANQANPTMKRRLPDDVLIERVSADVSGFGGLRLNLQIPGVKTTNYVSKNINFKVIGCNFTGGGIILNLAQPGSEGSVISNNVIFDNCIGQVTGTLTGTANDSWRFRGCTIGLLNSSGSLNAIKVYLENCEITDSLCGGHSTSEQWYYYNNRITTSATVDLGSRAVYCHGNTCPAGGAIYGRSQPEWWEYRDTSIFRTA